MAESLLIYIWKGFSRGGYNDSKGWTLVKDKFFTSHDFILLATCTTATLSWILGKPLLKPKKANIYTKR